MLAGKGKDSSQAILRMWLADTSEKLGTGTVLQHGFMRTVDTSGGDLVVG